MPIIVFRVSRVSYWGTGIEYQRGRVHRPALHIKRRSFHFRLIYPSHNQLHTAKQSLPDNCTAIPMSGESFEKSPHPVLDIFHAILTLVILPQDHTFAGWPLVARSALLAAAGSHVRKMRQIAQHLSVVSPEFPYLNSKVGEIKEILINDLPPVCPVDFFPKDRGQNSLVLWSRIQSHSTSKKISRLFLQRVRKLCYGRPMCT